MTASLPLFYFKPTICFVDDDQLFLDAINIKFKNYYNCRTCNDPSSAMSFFKTYKSPLSKINFKREFTESDVFGTYGHFPVDINLSAIKELLQLPEKAQEMAVLVIDYNMPTTNGLEICEILKSCPMKKILLTGEVSHEKAVEAFNNGIIDKFINKDIDISNKIKRCVDDLIYQYFNELTSNLISHIEASKPSLLSDCKFIEFFRSWLAKNNVEEYYLIAINGSFLIRYSDGRIAYFVVMSERDKKEFIKLNDEQFEKSDFLLSQVTEGTMIPFFGVGKESWEIDLSEWKNHFYPAQVIHGRENYYWTIVSE